MRTLTEGYDEIMSKNKKRVQRKKQSQKGLYEIILPSYRDNLPG
jgi:hypothetical protein